MNRKLALALLAASVTSGCSLTLDAEKVAPWENVENWCYAAVDLLMELEASCTPMTSDYESFQYRLFSEALLDCAGLQEAEDAGRIRFDSGAAKRCLEVLAAGDCFSDQEPCEGTIQGAVHEGGACTSYTDCAADTNGCDFSLSCPGTCQPLGGWGNPCYGHEECKSDFYCEFATMSCQYRVSAYATCAVGDPPEKCPDGYYCGNDGAQRCLPRPLLGMSCDASIPCDDRLGIVCDTFLTLPVCVTIPSAPSPIGAPCHAPYHCDEATAYCDGMYCQARRPLDQGYVCDYDDQCAFRGSCSVVQGEPSRTCQSIRRLGESCLGGHGQCLEGGYCDSAYDVSGTCRALPLLGQSCFSAEAAEALTCLSGTCNGSVGPSATCVPYAGPGDSCNVAGSVPCDWMAGLTCDPGSSTCVAAVCGSVF